MHAASLFLMAVCATGDPGVRDTFRMLTSVRGRFDGAERTMGDPVYLVRDGRATHEVTVPAGTPEVVRSAVELLDRVIMANTGARMRVRELRGDRAVRAIVPLVGDAAAAFADLKTEPSVGPQGFVIQRVGARGADRILVWSPTALGCRYGVIELLRSLDFHGGDCSTRIERVMSRPLFPLRIYYLNFGEHLQNAYNVNVLFDTDQCRWTLEQWHRLIEMVSAMRYNVFSFWLVPTLFDTAALKGGPLYDRFAETMCEVIRYAHSRGVLVQMLVAANTVGPEWRALCPHVPKEHDTILRLWDYWTRRIRGLDIVGLFPGDPGGCSRNGCDYRTCVDLYREIIARTQPNGPFIYEANTWGAPFFGWGVSSFGGDPARARDAFRYFIDALPSFPEETYAGICMGLNPDSDGEGCGGSAEPYVRAASVVRPVTTWDYGTSEGEATVIPRFRLPRIIQRRQKEATWPYVGGINYTMTPALNQLQAFATAECYWNPERSVEELLASYSRLAFGPGNDGIGASVFPYTEVVGDWGGGGWSGDLPALADGLNQARSALDQAHVPDETALALFPSAREAQANLRWHVDLLARLASTGADIEQARRLVASLGGPAEGADMLDAEETLASAASGPRRDQLADILARIRSADMSALRRQYWGKVYGIYDAIQRPVDPRSWGATDALFGRFGAEFVLVAEPSRLERLLRRLGTPYLNLDLGHAHSERGWTLSGWTLSGEFDGENWRASFAEPGVARRSDFRDRGYHWIVVRITDDTVPGRKSVWVNGTCVGTYVRPCKRLEWTTQQFPVPEGVLHDGAIEIRFTEPGVAVSDVALVTRPLTGGEIGELAAR